MRTKLVYKPTDLKKFKAQLLDWANTFNEVVWLDSHNHTDNFGSYNAVLATDAVTSFSLKEENSLKEFQAYKNAISDWLFGYISYDVKNEIEPILNSENKDGIGFEKLHFFQPKRLFLFYNDFVEICYYNSNSKEINNDLRSIETFMNADKVIDETETHIKAKISKKSYLNKVTKILSHIKRGDIYEANFCMEYFSENSIIQPIETFLNLDEISKAPFSTFLKQNDKFLLSASPERYISKQKNTLISQPIKGTAKRSKIAIEDKAIKEQLKSDSKERSENIMIVDLVRNDLSKIANKGSVKVEALCNVESYEQVHQMISTISSEIDCSVSFLDILKATFPMGSMTGAPKISAMQIIEDLEETKRGLYSGTVGYITPDNDFDFNVIIRSILYNATNKYISYSVGSAITAKSIPEKEYEECLLKAKAMRSVLENTLH